MNPEDFFDQYLEEPTPAFHSKLKRELMQVDLPIDSDIRRVWQTASAPRHVARWQMAMITIIFTIGAIFVFSNETLAQAFERMIAGIQFVSTERYVNSDETITYTPEPVEFFAATDKETIREAQALYGFQLPTYLPEGLILDGFNVYEMAHDKSRQIGLTWLHPDNTSISLSIFLEEEKIPFQVTDLDDITLLKIEGIDVAIYRGSFGNVDSNGDEIIFTGVTYFWVQNNLEYTLINNDEDIVPEEEVIKMIESIIVQD